MRRVWGVWLAVATLAAAGCKDSVTPGEGDSPSNVVFPATGVSYGREVQQLFNQTCAYANCHDSGPHPSALVLTTYEGLMYNSLQVVVRGKPDESVLVWRIDGRVGQRMPLNRNRLNDNQINGIRTWIAEGALNN